MDLSRPGPVPSKSQEDAFMDALLDGLGPSDFAWPSSSPPQQIAAQTSGLSQSRTANIGSRSQHASVGRPNASAPPSNPSKTSLHCFEKTTSQIPEAKRPRNSSASTSNASTSLNDSKPLQGPPLKSSPQLPEVKRQGSLMRYLKRPPASDSASEARGVNSNPGFGAHPRGAIKDHPPQVTSKMGFYHQPPTNPLKKSGVAHVHSRIETSCASTSVSLPPLAHLASVDPHSNLDVESHSITRNTKNPVENRKQDTVALLSGLEDGWDAFSDDEPEHLETLLPLCQQYTKCIVSHMVSEAEWSNSGRRLERRIEVTLESATGPVRKMLLLCDDWAETLLEPEDEINLVSLPGSPPLDLASEVITFSRREPGHLIILLPSLLINATTLSTAPVCPRRSVLNDRMKNSRDEAGEALVRGTIVHEVIQNMLLPTEQASAGEGLDDEVNIARGAWQETKISTEARKACVRHVEDLLMIQQTVDQGFAMVSDHLKELSAWSGKYIVQEHEDKSFKLKKDAHLSDPRHYVKDHAARPKIGITAICDVEEEIWSPKFGIKGIIDATIQAAIIEEPQKNGFFQANQLVTRDSSLLPLEIKTGRKPSGVAHTAQTMLYTLLMSDRYNMVIPAGLLFYTSYNELTRVQAVQAELRQLFIARNQLARYMHKRAIKHGEAELSQECTGVPDGSTSAREDFPAPDIERTLLPEPIDDPQVCSRCYALDSCMLVRKAIEKVDEFPFRRGLEPLQALYQDKTAHLTPSHSAFLTRWESLVSLEERELGKFKKEIWELTAKRRHKRGRAFADMEIDDSFDRSEWSNTARTGHAKHRFTYCLMSSITPSSADSPQKSQTGYSHMLATQSLLTGQIGVGDPIVVSIEGVKLALAKGFVCELTPHRIVISVDHRLESLGPVPVGSIVNDRYMQNKNTAKNLYRLDKDELMAGMGRLRDNLAQLFYANGDVKRRELIVDLRPPEFNDVLKSARETQPNHLNEDQYGAIDKVMSAKDYALILGMPGTGKTTTIVEVIKVLVKKGKSIILTSYTHSAVDNILSKLISSNINMLRLGNIDRIASALHPYTLDDTRPFTSVEALEEKLMAPPLVATTCLSINHPIFKRRNFDYCIIDEASQITLPACLGPLRFARIFVLVGDHFQLPPLVKNPLAKAKGLETSLFKLLSENHPDAVACLSRQYRMNEDIMSLSNVLIYDGRLKCANESVSQLSLEIPRGIDLGYLHTSDPKTCADRCWLADILAPERRVVFVDTDNIQGAESTSGSLVQNAAEAHLVAQIVSALLNGGVAASEIGVITPYRQQIKLLAYLLERAPGVEIITADKAQGRDKACVIMTMVRSNSEGQVGELLRDWRRINVCLTRARQKLIILGSRRTLKSSDILRDFLGLVEARAWIYQLEAGAESAHQYMSDTSNQTTIIRMPSPVTPLKRKSVSSLDRISPELKYLRKTHHLLKDITTHILMEGESS